MGWVGSWVEGQIFSFKIICRVGRAIDLTNRRVQESDPFNWGGGGGRTCTKRKTKAKARPRNEWGGLKNN